MSSRRARPLAAQDDPNVDPRVLRLFYSQRDLQFALSAFDFLAELDVESSYSKIELRRFRCYLDAGIIAYGRPFTATVGVPTLSLKQIGVRPTPAEKHLHDELMAYRHKVVAHSDVERMRIAVTSFQPFDDHEVSMPVMTIDEGLPFLDERPDVVLWLHRLMHALASKTFEIVQQGSKQFAFTTDYMAKPDIAGPAPTLREKSP